MRREELITSTIRGYDHIQLPYSAVDPGGDIFLCPFARSDFGGEQTSHSIDADSGRTLARSLAHTHLAAASSCATIERREVGKQGEGKSLGGGSFNQCIGRSRTYHMIKHADAK